MTINLSEQNTIANKYVAELRHVEVQKDRMRFRRNLERLGEVIGYEISKKLDYKTIETKTPLGVAKVSVPSNRIVLATILRAGLPMHQGLLNIYDDADNAFVSAYRKHNKDGSFEIKTDYISCPNLEGCTLILADPMLATGASMDITLQELKTYGKPATIHIVTAIASADGLAYIEGKHPDCHIWMGALDEELTARSYIVPGLGDAGDLSYGSKVQD